MKKIIIPVLLIIVVIPVIIWVIRSFGGFIFSNRQPSTPITDFFDQIPGSVNNSQVTEQGENTTGFPLKLPDGFSIHLFARNLGKPRVMTWDPQGRILVSIPASGTVVALTNTDEDVEADTSITVKTNLNSPHGIAFYQNKLYIAETDAVAVYDYDVSTAKASNRKKIVDLSGGGNHFSRTIGFGPEDGKLYISAGSTCNACNEKDWRRALIMVANPDGSDLRPYATGLRNSVFFTWSYVDGRMWATDMGRDLIGDDIPPEEINIIQEGAFYGWPYCYGKNVQDTVFDKSSEAQEKCTKAEPSYIDMQAHSAPLGLAFIPEEGWPQEYWYNLLVAFHGSWNRSQPTGYKVVRIKLDDKGKYLGIEDFITGWQTENDVLGRPVDILIQPGGVMYLSDDKAGVVYKITGPGPQ